jgi:hypothetical protein
MEPPGEDDTSVLTDAPMPSRECVLIVTDPSVDESIWVGRHVASIAAIRNTPRVAHAKAAVDCTRPESASQRNSMGPEQ